MLRNQKGTRLKGWLQSNVRFGPVFDIEVCDKHGRYSIEVQVQSLFEDHTESLIKLVNGIDKFVREAMPIQEEEKASWKTNTETLLNRWLGLDSYGTKTMDRH